MSAPKLQDKVIDALKTVQDPDLHKDIVSLGFVKNLNIDGGNVKFDVELTTPACPVKEQLRTECETKVQEIEGVEDGVAFELYWAEFNHDDINRRTSGTEV